MAPVIACQLNLSNFELKIATECKGEVIILFLIFLIIEQLFYNPKITFFLNMYI